MLCALIAALTGAQLFQDTQHFRILFLGNSHTAFNDVPRSVAGLLTSIGASVEYETVTGGHLDDLAKNAGVLHRIDNGGWSHVVLQGAMISSSHKYEYPQNLAIVLAKRAAATGATPLYYAEWPRKGWDESDYIFDHYEVVRKAAGGSTMPVCYAWDRALKENPQFDLWSADGNHANASGSFLAASTIAYWIAGTSKPMSLVPPHVDAQSASALNAIAKGIVDEHRKKSKDS